MKQPSKPRWKRWLLAATLALGLGGGAVMSTDMLNGPPSPPPSGNNSATTSSVIYYEDRVTPFDPAAVQPQKRVHQTFMITADPDRAENIARTIIIPVDFERDFNNAATPGSAETQSPPPANPGGPSP